MHIRSIVIASRNGVTRDARYAESPTSSYRLRKTNRRVDTGANISHGRRDVRRVIRQRIIGSVWSVEWWDVDGMILARAMLDDTGRKVAMSWRWSSRRRECGITRVTSESAVLSASSRAVHVRSAEETSYVHRLIQTRNDGKLVELPSASSLVTSFARPLPFNDQPRTPRHRLASTESALSQSQTTPPNGTPNGSSSEAGPSSNDIDKMSTIEAITLEYSYLLSSQLEAMRQHYETQQSDLQTRLSSLESQMTDVHRLSSSLESAQKEKEKAEKKAKQATELSRSLQTSLAAERAMTQGLSERVKMLENVRERTDREKRELEDEKMGLEETVKDLMFSLEAGIKIQQLGGEGGEGGDLVVRANEKPTKGKKGKK